MKQEEQQWVTGVRAWFLDSQGKQTIEDFLTMEAAEQHAKNHGLEMWNHGKRSWLKEGIEWTS